MRAVGTTAPLAKAATFKGCGAGVAGVARPLQPYRAGAPLDPDAFATIRLRMALEFCKWDPQVGDTCTLSRFPLVMGRAAWRELAGLARELAAETLAAEAELLSRPDLHRRLALPWAVGRALREVGSAACGGQGLRLEYRLVGLRRI